MRNLIKKVLREFNQPVLVYEIVLKKSLQEQDFIRQIGNTNVSLFKNKHSQRNIGTSSFSRVDPKFIESSVYENENDIVDLAKHIITYCEGKGCSIIVVDEPNGFDYHVWLEETLLGNIRMIINTSIYHPKHIYNSEKNPMLIITMRGDIKTRFV
jgi:hypothetical protein